MIDRIRQFFAPEKLEAARQTWHRFTGPIARGWEAVAAPIRGFFAPVAAFWKKTTAPVAEPIRARWAVFSQKWPRLAFVFGWLGTLAKWGIGFLVGLFLLTWMGLFGKIPSKDALRNIQTANATEIYSQDSVLLGKYFFENRNTIDLKDISPNVVNALVATEDKRFFEHSGIDYTSLLRVAYKTVLKRNEQSGGGSTLSQQLAKNLYPRKKYWVPGVGMVVNKFRENIIGIKLEDIYSKDELLALYLNTVPFGTVKGSGEIFGISVASKEFFNKKPKDLRPDEAALLIGMLKGTTLYNPRRNPEKSKDRRNTVLVLMKRNGHLEEPELKKLMEKPLGIVKARGDNHSEGLATYFREYLRAELPKILKQKGIAKEDGKPYSIYTDGLRVHTTINSVMQKYAEESVAEHMKKLQGEFDRHWKGSKTEKPWGDDKWLDDAVRKSDRWERLKEGGKSDDDCLKNFAEPVKMTVFAWKNAEREVDTTMTPFDSVKYFFCLMNAGFMCMDHRNGSVRAWVGGVDFKYFKYDHVKSTRQVGSTFKPIVYAAALKDSVSPCEYFHNIKKQILDWNPDNADNRYGGYYNMQGALKNSVNVIAAQLIERVGIQKTIDLARKMGVSSHLPREFGISLGAADISLYEMMTVYATIANAGIRPNLNVVSKITTRDGKVLVDFQKERLEKEKAKTPRDTALSAYHAGVMTKMMQKVIDEGTGKRFRQGHGLQGDFAGKTGTTQNHSDGWFICFNPFLVTGSWVGAESPAVRFRNMSLGQGSHMALPICGTFWWKMGNDKKFSKMFWEPFKFPKGAEYAAACPNFLGSAADTSKVDSLRLDSTSRDYARSLKERIKAMFPKKEEEVTDGEPGADEDLTPLKPGEKKDEKKKSDPKLPPADPKKPDQKEGLLRRIFKKDEKTEAKKPDKKDEKTPDDKSKAPPKKPDAKQVGQPATNPKKPSGERNQ